MNKRKDHIPKKNIMYTLEEDNSRYIINESYFYKTEPYYTIVKNEHEGIKTVPSSSDVLDAYIVPICLEKAKLAGISVCEWVISYQYVSLPSIVYGLNYFSTPEDHFVVSNIEEASKIIKHITNRGKYLAMFNRHQLAILAFKEALALDPNLADAWKGLAESEAKLRNP